MPEIAIARFAHEGNSFSPIPTPIDCFRGGEWAVGGVSGGNWSLDFSKEGYETRSLTVQISESSRPENWMPSMVNWSP